MPGPLERDRAPEDDRRYVLEVYPPDPFTLSRAPDALLYQLNERLTSSRSRRLSAFEGAVCSVEEARAFGLAEFARRHGARAEEVDARLVVVGPPGDGQNMVTVFEPGNQERRIRARDVPRGLITPGS